MSKGITKKIIKNKKKPKLTAEQKAQLKEQKAQRKEISTLLKNIGFKNIPSIDGKEFIFNNRTSEIDDIFFHENVILLMEYTITNDPGAHLLNKEHFYQRVCENPSEFIKFAIQEPKLKSFASAYNTHISSKYSLSKIIVKILYCSKKTISPEHKRVATSPLYFDYHLVKYFSSLSKVIKRSTIHEFIDFLGIPYKSFGENSLKSHSVSKETFSGHILPEEHSSFSEGYKIVSFYMDANSLLRRSYVLRKEGWRKKENVGHYQRMLIPSKISGMRKYLHEKNRVFVNNIIATLSLDKIKLYDENDEQIAISSDGQIIGQGQTAVTPTKIEINNEPNIIGVVDGQHRTFAYHEGDDNYEVTISKLREIQNLLITGILYPQSEAKEKRLKFEANLFLEINANQAGASSQLKQEIELMIDPFSTISIAKAVLNSLNNSGPLSGLFEEFWYEKGKLKTSSVISYGLNQLVKLDGNESLFSSWSHPDKEKLRAFNSESYELLTQYKEYCTTEIREIFIAFKSQLDSSKWKIDRKDPNCILSVTTINGILNCLRLLTKNKKLDKSKGYSSKLTAINNFNFKNYKSSQYRQMGEKLYSTYF
ncbi:hypothetical protein thsps21_16060 [Pseudomonas sp. No.21]|uniref:DGQHR domain-containing protein n=1 Tax=Pseudomonas tohonis TaxID=2725477 RepID=UPI001F39481B|nr:DGQHR domain-containing protein [Pseudomonas tohonis]GJN44592.1 hypothetical protein TUM20249_05780 [Pseudomonas tohonis]